MLHQMQLRSVVAVHVAGDRDRRVPEQIGHGLDVHTRLQPGDGCAVPQRVHPDAVDARGRGGNLDHPQ